MATMPIKPKLNFPHPACDWSHVSRSGPSFIPISTLELQGLLWFVAAIVVGVTLGTMLRFPARYLMGSMAVSAGLHYLD